MKFLPIAASSILHGWQVLLITLTVALVPGVGVFIWAVFFRKRGVRRVRRRRRRPVDRAANPAIARTNVAPPISREQITGEPRS
ncbi:MAG TPA: hypothetical protein VME24_02330 [Alphaproteobacteria bacterium]|nr:hypothetical protein [Alphaproteobacteria bacterium]